MCVCVCVCVCGKREAFADKVLLDLDEIEACFGVGLCVCHGARPLQGRVVGGLRVDRTCDL